MVRCTFSAIRTEKSRKWAFYTLTEQRVSSQNITLLSLFSMRRTTEGAGKEAHSASQS